MNIFVLSSCPVAAAQMQCDKHVVKMIVESAQMLSTAHRILDGTLSRGPSKSGKTMSKKWVHPSSSMDELLYKAVHMNHPCTVWTMQSTANYQWHYEHFIALCDEYTYRYGKIHATDTKLRVALRQLPQNIPVGSLTPQPLAMKSNPECMFLDDVMKSYRAFYQTKQDRFKMAWTKREIPDWFQYKGVSV
jgi:hypothetical protein